MTINVLPLMGMPGSLSMFVLFVVLGLLSKRLGSVTKSPPYFIGFFASALLMATSILLQILDARSDISIIDTPDHDTAMMLIHAGLPALALTIALPVAWRYWSWLLAERS